MNTWTNAKIGGGGYVTGLIFHPTSANILYARTDIGGAYRWNQAKTSWTPMTDGFSARESFYQGAESIALDPNDDQLVYMSTGLYNSADPTGRLYISNDRGNNWTSVNLPFACGANNNGRAIGERMMVDPNKASRLFYGSRTAGLWKSADSGRTWTQVTSLSSAKMTSAQISAAGGSAMGVELVVYDTNSRGSGVATQTIYTAIAPDYASVAGLANMYKSTDAGETWTSVSTPVSGYHIPHMVRAADGMFYVLFTNSSGPGSGGPGRFYKFDGANWTLLASTNSAGYGGVSVHGSGATTRIALGVSGTWGDYSGQQVVQLSDDAGSTWREIEAMMPHTPPGSFSGWVDDIEIDPFDRDHILHVNGGGIVETRNASSATPSWAVAVDGLEENAVSDLATPPAGATYAVITSAGDIGTWVHTDLTKKPTFGPTNMWNSTFCSDMAWSDSQYMVTIGVANWNNGAATGFWSGDGGSTWTAFATLPPGVTTNPGSEASIAVTERNKAVWSPSNAAASYTTNNGASWAPTNLPALPSIGGGIGRGYHLRVDRQNSNKVYAYDSGGHWWGTAGKVHVSTDGGHTFTLSQGSVAAALAPNYFTTTALAVNPNLEGDLWLADGNALYHSTDSGATWQKVSAFASIWGNNPWPDVQGATAVALGKAKAGAMYSAAVYVVGVVNGVWGVFRSDDGGATWTRFNDDTHQFGGIGAIAADQNLYGRLYVAGNGRGVLYS